MQVFEFLRKKYLDYKFKRKKLKIENDFKKRFSYVGIVEVHDDFSISVLSNGACMSYIEVKGDQCLDEFGSLLYKIRYVDSFGIHTNRLKNCKNFPDNSIYVDVISTKLKKFSFNRIEKILTFRTSVEELEINEIAEDFFISGDISDLKTLENIPTATHFFMAEPFKVYEKDTENTLKYEKCPRNRMFIEYLFLRTKESYSNYKISLKKDTNNFRQALYTHMEKNKSILGIYELYSDYKDLFDFSTVKKKIVKQAIKFNL